MTCEAWLAAAHVTLNGWEGLSQGQWLVMEVRTAATRSIGVQVCVMSAFNVCQQAGTVKSAGVELDMHVPSSWVQGLSAGHGLLCGPCWGPDYWV